MTISYQQGASNGATNAGPVTVTFDSTPAAGDLILLFHVDADTTDNAMPAVSGYTDVGTSEQYANSTNDCNSKAWYKYSDGTETNVVCPDTGGGTNDGVSAVVLIFRGVAALADGGPFSTAIQKVTGTGSGHADPPQIATATDDVVVIMGAAAHATTGVTFTAPANYTTNAEPGTPGSDTIAAGAGMAYRTSGYANPENPGAFTASATAAGDSWNAVTLALKAEVVVNATANPATVEVSTSLPASTPQAGAISAVSGLDISASLPAPTIIAESGSADATATPDTIACTISLPDPTLASPQIITPATVEVASRVGDSWSDVAVASTLAGAANVTVTPSIIAVAASLPAPTLLAGATALPDAIAATTSLADPTIQGKAVAAPSTIAASVSIPDPTILVAGAATATPATIAVQANLPAPTVQGKSLTAPSVLATSSSVGVVTTQAGAKPTPSTVAATTSLPAPTVQGKAIVQPSTVTVAATVPTPTVLVGGSAVVTPATVALSASIPTPTVVAVSSVTVTPATIGIAASIPTPTVLVAGNVTVTPATIAVTTSVLAPTLRSAQTVTPAAIVISASVQASTIHSAAVVQGLTITGVVGLPPPIVFGGSVGQPVEDPQAVLVGLEGQALFLGSEGEAVSVDTEGKAVMTGIEGTAQLVEV